MSAKQTSTPSIERMQGINKTRVICDSRKLISETVGCERNKIVEKMSIPLPGSRSRHNFHAENEGLINKQINMELHAFYVYKSMASFFNRDDVALPGFANYFFKEADEEKSHADKLISYQSLRGGRVVYRAIDKPQRDDWDSPLHAMECALELEKQVNKSLLDIHEAASRHTDPHLQDFLEDNFLKEQVESVDKIARLITNLKRVGDGLGIYIFDKDLQ